MSGGVISRSVLNDKENQELLEHLKKHKVYPYKYKIKKTINSTNFINNDVPGGGGYFTYAFTPQLYLGIVYLAANFIITPNTVVGTFALAISYASVFSFGDNAVSTLPDLEGTDTYMLLSNGGAINDFQVFFPLNWYLETNKTIYIHGWADSATILIASAVMQGQFTFGTLVTNRQ
jgi:hypothetical protein